MDRLAETARRNVRAREIYEWFLSRPDVEFRARDVSKEFRSLVNIQAMRLLVDQGLILAVSRNGLNKYKLKRIAPIETCLDIPLTRADPTIKRYRVFPSVACEMPTADNLEDYAITK